MAEHLVFLAERNLQLDEISYPFLMGKEIVGKLVVNDNTTYSSVLTQIQTWRDQGYQVSCDVE